MNAPSFKSSGKNGSEMDSSEQEPQQPPPHNNGSNNTATTEVTCS